MMKTNICLTCKRPIVSRNGVKKRCGSQSEKGSCAHLAKKARITIANEKRLQESKGKVKNESYHNSDWCDYSS